MTAKTSSPTATLRSALAAHRAEAPAWKRQRTLNAVLTAAAALADTIRAWEGPEGKLERWWQEVDALKGQPGYEAAEEKWVERNGRYEEARELLGEAEEVLKREGVR